MPARILTRPRRAARAPSPAPVGTGLSRSDSVGGLRSVPVLRRVILVAGFLTMTGMTKALPVVLIPEQDAVTSVRFDMIHISRLDVPTFLHAFYTQRMCRKVTLAGFVPCTAVAALVRSAYLLRVERSMLFTVFCTIWNKCRTAGVLAWCIGSAWHRMKPPFIFSTQNLLINFYLQNQNVCVIITVGDNTSTIPLEVWQYELQY